MSEWNPTPPPGGEPSPLVGRTQFIVLVGLLLGMVAVFGGFVELVIVAVFGAIAFLVAKVIDGSIDISGLTGRGRIKQ